MTIARKLAAGLVAALFATLVPTLALAQEATSEDDVLQRYELATESLANAAAALPADAVEARTALDRAFSALLTLSRGDSSALSDSLDRVFELARTAIDNRSATNLAVQTQVLRGGFQRLLFEAALTAAVEGRTDLARARLLELARDLELGAARIEQLEALTESGPIRQVLEAGVAEQVVARLEALAAAAPPTDRDATYLLLARAYADYLLVQDSGRLDPASNQRFVDAAHALVDGDDERYLASLGALVDDLAELRDAADAGAPPREGLLAGESVVADLDGDESEQGVSEAPTDDQAEPAEATEGATEGVESTAEDAETADADGADAAPVPSEVDLEALRAEIEAELSETIAAELEAEREARAIEELARELTALGVSESERGQLAGRLHRAGVASIASLERELASLAISVEGQVLLGRNELARATLERMERLYGPAPSSPDGINLAAIVVRVDPAADARMRETFDRLEQAPMLRSSDATLLAAEVASLSESMRGAALDSYQASIVTVAGWWSGWIRPAVMIALALLALLPLRLLSLAFGRGNRNWRLIRSSLFLLLLPLFVEGILGVLALLAEPVGIPSLAYLGIASVFANEATQFAWAVVMLLAVLFAAFGFYGICVQFGVLGRRRDATATTTTSTRVATKDETLVDWDDEF